MNIFKANIFFFHFVYLRVEEFDDADADVGLDVLRSCR